MRSPDFRRIEMADVQRTIMRTVGTLSIQLYRWSNGRVMGKVRGVRVLLLTVAGRKTGVEHTTAVSYFEDDGRFVVTGSAGGSPSEPQWFKNLRQADRAVIEVGPTRIDVTVQIAGLEEHKVWWDKLIAVAPFFAKYQTKVEREIPMAILTPTG
jgi:deazaflavin-dependent oxidoreductase (nitroreductase family)